MVDPQYIDMVGNMHLRNEKRKANFESTMV